MKMDMEDVGCRQGQQVHSNEKCEETKARCNVYRSDEAGENVMAIADESSKKSLNKRLPAPLTTTIRCLKFKKKFMLLVGGLVKRRIVV